MKKFLLSLLCIFAVAGICGGACLLQKKKAL